MNLLPSARGRQSNRLRRRLATGSSILLKHRQDIHRHSLIHRGAVETRTGEGEDGLLVDVACQLSARAGGVTGVGGTIAGDGAARDVVEVPIESCRSSLGKDGRRGREVTGEGAACDVVDGRVEAGGGACGAEGGRDAGGIRSGGGDGT